MVAYGGGHVAALAPVAKKLEETGHEVVFLALTTAKNYLDKRNIKSIGFKDILFLADNAAIEYGQKLAANLEGRAVSHEESVAYLGMSYSDLAAQYGGAEAEKLYAQHKRQAFLPVASLKKALLHYKPDIVVATNSPRAERAAIIAAGKLKIPAVCVVDLFAVKEIDWIGKPGFADRICVLNNNVKDRFIEAGRALSDVVVTGNPAFDALLEEKTRQAGAGLRKQRGWDDGKINILWASQPEPLKHPFSNVKGDPHLPYDIENRLREFVAENDGFRLVVRYHPSQNDVFREGKNVDFSPAHDEVAAVIHACDMCVTITSTVALEAHIAGKPVITVDKSIFTEEAPFSKMGIALGVKEIAALPEAILTQLKQAIAQKQQESKNATDKVIESIELLGKHV